MKKLVLLFTGLLMGLTAVTANTTSNSDDRRAILTSRYHHAQPIIFVERGIEFIVFPNGDFDFNTAFDGYGYNYYNDDLYYRRNNTRRGSVGVTAPGTTSRYYEYGPRGVQVIHDRWGNVRRVGHVFINYDYYGRVKRIGSVYIRYRRHRMVQIGGLRLFYNRHGQVVRTRGIVNRHWNWNHNYNHFGWDNDYHWNDDDDHFYYRKNGKTIKKYNKFKNKKFKLEKDDLEYDDD